MKTEDLIRALEADNQNRTFSLDKVWRISLVLAIVIAALVFQPILGPRADFADAAQTIRFLFKFVFTVTLAVSAFALLQKLSRPGEKTAMLTACLAIAPALMAIAIVLEMFTVPEQQWGTRLIGTYMYACLASIPLIGIGPLAVFIIALRHSAPARPALAGAVAGLLAGSIAATFYAAHCIDDSPFFVATWYTIAIAALVAIGALAGKRFIRW